MKRHQSQMEPFLILSSCHPMVHSQSCNKEKGGKAETDENSKLFFDNWLLSIGFTHAPSSAL